MKNRKIIKRLSVFLSCLLGFIIAHMLINSFVDVLNVKRVCDPFLFFDMNSSIKNYNRIRQTKIESLKDIMNCIEFSGNKRMFDFFENNDITIEIINNNINVYKKIPNSCLHVFFYDIIGFDYSTGEKVANHYLWFMLDNDIEYKDTLIYKNNINVNDDKNNKIIDSIIVKYTKEFLQKNTSCYIYDNKFCFQLSYDSLLDVYKSNLPVRIDYIGEFFLLELKQHLDKILKEKGIIILRKTVLTPRFYPIPPPPTIR